MEAYSENAMETTGRLPRLAVAEAIARALGLVPSWLRGCEAFELPRGSVPMPWRRGLGFSSGR